MLVLLLLLPLLLLPAYAGSPEEDFAPLRSEAGPGWVDWSEGELHASARAEPSTGAFSAQPVVEQQALDRLGPQIEQVARRLRVTSSLEGADLLDESGPLGKLLGEYLGDWEVDEARYHASGAVELDAELSLLRWLKPFFLHVAPARLPKGPGGSGYTGVLVDARHLDAEPAVAPRLLGPGGELLYGLPGIPASVLRRHLPVLYVADPADPRAVRLCGDHPLLLVAEGVEDEVDLRIAAGDVPALRRALQDPAILGAARVALVLSQPDD